MLTLCGCSAKLPFTQNRTADFDTCYTVTADITCGELEATADVKRSGNGEWEFCFTEPKELSGLTLTLSENGLTANLGALSFTTESNSAYTLVPEIISQVVDGLSEAQTDSISEEEGVVTVKTDIGGKNVTITASKDTWELISLKCPYYQLAVYFSGQTELPDTVETAEAAEPAAAEYADDGSILISG